MKNLMFLTLTLILTGLTGFTSLAQADLENYSFNPELKESSRLMSKGEMNSYSVIIDGVSKKDIEKSWQKYMKECDSKCKWDKGTKEFLANDAEIKGISDNTIDVYSQLLESNNRVELVVWMDLGGGFLTSRDHAERAKAGEAFLMNFATDMEKKRIDDFRKNEEDKLGKMEKDLKNLQKDKGKLEKSIEDYQKKIEEAKQKIAENAENQTLKEKEIKVQGEYIGKVKAIKTTLGN